MTDVMTGGNRSTQAHETSPSPRLSVSLRLAPWEGVILQSEGVPNVPEANQSNQEMLQQPWPKILILILAVLITFIFTLAGGALNLRRHEVCLSNLS